MTFPTSDAQSARFLPRRPQMLPPSHSMPVTPSVPPPTTFPATLPPFATGFPRTTTQHEDAINFATHSLDLATGGMKALTAKRELPTRPDRRPPDRAQDVAVSHSYAFVLAILVCVVLMLIGGGVVLFVMLQP